MSSNLKISLSAQNERKTTAQGNALGPRPSKNLSTDAEGDLPDGWQWKTVAELAADEPRSITDGPFGSKLKTAHYTDKGPRVIRLQNIGDGEFFDAKAHISEEHYQTLQNHKVDAGDIVIAAMGEDPPRACTIPATLGPAIVKADCIRFKPNPIHCTKFLQYALNSPGTRRRAKVIVHGVGRPRLNQGEIKAIQLPVPPPNEQRRIVARIEELFSRLDAGVAALRHAKAQLQRYRQSVLAAAVTGQLTGTNGAPYEWQPIATAIESLGQGWSPNCKRTRSESNEVWGVIKTTAIQAGEYVEYENKELPN